MATRYRFNREFAGRRAAAPRHHVGLSIVLVTAGATLSSALLLVPGPLVLPVLNAVFFVAAGAAALLARAAIPLNGQKRLELWDVAGACALIGIAAGIFGDAEAAIGVLSRPDR